VGLISVWEGGGLCCSLPVELFCSNRTCLVLHGSRFQLHLQNNTFWKPDSCQDCRCRSSVVTCEPTACRAPQCDFQKGEVLQIASNKCCPECASRAKGFCQHEGQIHSHGTQWTSSGCVRCSCAHGKVTCSPRTCPALSCGQGELQDTAQDSCCPKCVGRGEPCSFDGHVFQDGEGWSLGRCSRCVCRDGATLCSTASCQPLLCSQVRTLLPSRKCSSAPPFPWHGEQWQKNACTACVCQRGEVRCLRETCGSVTCQKGESKVQRPGKCCEECVSSKGSCLHGGTVRYHGEMWNSTSCDFCLCQEGQVTCQGAECAKVECAKVRKAFFCQDGPVKSWDFYFFFPTSLSVFSQLETLALVLCSPLKNISQGRRANLEFPMQVCTVGFHCEANQ
uniref:VWFC domain-containing protein n=1 Tax=Cyanistes caeruleus TaxID=156563 RepID=A0A8C0ZJM5_CYACU